MAMWRCASLLLTSHAAVALRSSTLGLRRSPRIAMALAPGTKVEGALLKQLKVSGRRAAVFVVPSDQSSIEVFERCEARASEFKSLGCTPIAIRPADAALVDTATTYPSVSFLDDAPKVHALMEPHTPLRARSAPHLRAHPRLPLHARLGRHHSPARARSGQLADIARPRARAAHVCARRLAFILVNL